MATKQNKRVAKLFRQYLREQNLANSAYGRLARLGFADSITANRERDRMHKRSDNMERLRDQIFAELGAYR